MHEHGAHRKTQRKSVEGGKRVWSTGRNVGTLSGHAGMQ